MIGNDAMTDSNQLIFWLDLSCAVIAAAVWYLFPTVGLVPLVLLVAPKVVRRVVEGRFGRISPFDPWLILFILTAIGGILVSYDRALSLEKFQLILGAIGLYLAISQSDDRQKEWMTWGLAAAGVVFSLYFILTHDWDAYPTKVLLIEKFGRIIQQFLPQLNTQPIHPNVLAGTLLVILPFSAACFKMATTAIMRLLSALMTGTILLGLLLAVSRGAWLAIVATMLLAIGWRLLQRFKWFENQTVKRTVILALFLVAIGLFVTIIHAQSVPRLVELVVGGAERLQLYRASYSLAGDYIFTGGGLGGFRMLHASYVFLTHVGHSIHAHNLLLDLVIQQGIFGAIAILGLWATLYAKITMPQVVFTPTSSAATFAATAILLHGFTDDAHYSTGAILFLFIPFAFVAFDKGSADRFPQLSKWLLRVLGFVFVFILMLFWRPVLAAITTNQAAVLQSRAELGEYSWPEYPIQDALRQKLDMQPVVALYEQALAQNPHQPSAARRLAQIELTAGNAIKAGEILQPLHEARPWDNAVTQMLGEAFIANGHIDAGKELWRTVHNQNGQLTTRAFWYRWNSEVDKALVFDMVIEEISE